MQAGYSAGMERVWEDLRQCHRLRNEMAHLVTSCQAYIMFEVLEAAWTAFLQKLTTTQDLDGLIRESHFLCSSAISRSNFFSDSLYSLFLQLLVQDTSLKS